MENSEYKEKKTTFHPFRNEDKHYFGGYFNLAENNIKEVFNELGQRFGIEKKSNPTELLEEVFKENMALTNYEKWVNAFAEYFPIVNFLDRANEKQGDKFVEISKEERIRSFKKNFKLLIKTVDRLRHYYTHAHHDPISIEEEFFQFLDHVLFDTIISTKKNYLKTDKTKEAMSKSLQEELDKLYRLKIEQLEKKQKEPKDKGKSFKFGRDKKQIINSLYNDAFKDFVYNNSELTSKSQTKSNDKNKLPDADFESTISQSGIVFLLSLFLNKKEITLFKSKIVGYKATIIKENYDLKNNSLKFMATQRIYSVLAYKGLKRKIRTSSIANKETLLMQMLDELSKVPDVVYQNLSDDDKKKFVEDWNEYYKDNEENKENLENSKVVHPVIRKRYDDKFNYFALRFLDEFANFPSLRFQVYLGNYVHQKEDKKLSENLNFYEREIKEKITVFARLSEISNAKADYFQGEVSKQGEDQPFWELFPNPSYLFPKEQGDGERVQKNAGKIGIRYKLNSKLYPNTAKYRSIKSSKARKEGKETKMQIVENNFSLKHKINGQNLIRFYGEALAFLSMNDIHALLYEKVVNKASGQELENIISEKIEKQINQIIEKTTSIKILKKYNSASEPINRQKLEKDLKKDLDTIKERINEQRIRFEEVKENEKSKKTKKSGSEKKRKYILTNSEKGKVAVWIANDLKKFMPQEFKNDWKGYQHRELQRSFAYYETNRELIEKTLLEGLDFRQIPFGVKQCFQKEKLHEFYSQYLRERENYLKRLIEKFQKSKENPNEVYNECFKFLKKKNYLSNGLDVQVQRILASPIFLERGFLSDKPTMKKGLSFEENQSEFADWFVEYKKYQNYQRFYNTDEFPLIEKEKKEKKAQNAIERKIKQQQKNDFFTLMMAKTIYNELFSADLKINLEEIYKDRKQRNDDNLDSIWNKRIDLELFEGKMRINVKLKDVGNFRKYENDKRVKTMISCLSNQEWLAYLPNDGRNQKKPTNVIEKQLEAYESIRSEKLLKEVQVFENDIYENIITFERAEILLEELKNENGTPNFKHYILNGLLKNMMGVDISTFKNFNLGIKVEDISISNLEVEASEYEQKAFILTYIRNKFAHNKLPKREFFEYCLKLKPLLDDMYFAEYYLEIFKETANYLRMKKNDL